MEETPVTMDRPVKGVMEIRIRVEEEEPVLSTEDKMLFILTDLQETAAMDTFSPMKRHTGEVEAVVLPHNIVPGEALDREVEEQDPVIIQQLHPQAMVPLI